MSMNPSIPAPAIDAAAADRQTRSAVAIAMVLLGALLVWGAGLAQPAFVHNAAHDSRHALTYPCH
jgi:cobalt transporter subunit CbtB